LGRCVVFTLAILGAGLAVALSAPPASSEPCEDCHDQGDISEGDRSVHPPFEEWDCTSCHEDHGDEERLVLIPGGNALCEECHDFSDGDFVSSHRGVTGSRASCLSCHDPHRSTLTALLRQGRHRPLAYGRCDPCHRFDGHLHKPTVRELCLECHDREEFSRSYGHSPVVEGDCLDCHDPHGSRRRALLLEAYSGDRWIGSGEEDYLLCLGCHEAEAFTASGEEETTEFRSGSENLHRTHVEGRRGNGKFAADRGIACRNCHEVHSAAWPRLIRGELDCGGVPCLMLEFKSTPGGGECSVSCHGTKAYGRDGTVPLPSPPPAPPQPPPRDEGLDFPEPTALEKSINRRCRSCHDREVQGFARPHVHLPVRRGHCSACHLDHGSDNTLVLLDRQDRLCARCHDLESDPVRAAHGGYSLERSTCSECHDPHGADNASLLYSLEHDPFAERDCGTCHGDPDGGWEIGEGINEACGQCHDDVADYPFLHGALPGKSCKGCHRPHGGDEEQFLREKIPGLCHRCHEETLFNLETVHSPVEDGDCGVCHPVHGSEEKGLFAGPYPLEQYLSFSAGAYGLCWECHDEESLTDSASEETGFRSGGENLHVIHVRDRLTVTDQGDRSSPGVTCRSCHDPHSTEGPSLVRREMDCDGIPCLQLEYHKVGDGGRCLGGCHARQSYLP
jgi:predicted CXXCH cytochrome family protein